MKLRKSFWYQVILVPRPLCGKEGKPWQLDIPWATEEGREEHRRVMELSAAKRKL